MATGPCGDHADLALFERSVVSGLAGVGPLAARVGLGRLQVDPAPALVGEVEVVAAELGGFFGPHGGVVEAAEVGLEPLSGDALGGDGGEQVACLGRVGDAAPVDLSDALGVLLDGGERVGNEDLPLDRVLGQVVEDLPPAWRDARGADAAVEADRDAVEELAEHVGVGEGGGWC